MMLLRRAGVVFKVKNVTYTCYVLKEKDVDVEKVKEIVENVLGDVQAVNTQKTVLEYLQDALVKLAAEFVILEKALKGVEDEGKR